MKLDEAIKHCEEVANDRAGCCEDCAEEHRQLAGWLKELKAVREAWSQLTETVIEIRDNAETEDIRNCARFIVNYLGILEKEIMEEVKNDNTRSN